jgi:hypothetical protein
MIRFNMDNKQLAIDFSYDHVDGCRITIAKILDDKQVESIGFAAQDSRDRDVKEVGRKIALRRLMTTAKYNRQERTAIWKAYHTRGNRQI